MNSRVVQILARASRPLLEVVASASHGEDTLRAMSQTALAQSDRKVLNSLLEECKAVGHDYARGVAAGLLFRPDVEERRLVVSAPYKTDLRETAGVIAELVCSSESTLDICSYVLMYLDELIPLFSSARKRGVTIRILLDAKKSEDSSTSKTLELLMDSIGAGSVRRWGDDVDKESLHAKFLIADAHRALISSANLTGRAITRNIEAGVLFRDTDLIHGLQEFFEELWEGSR